MAKRFYDHIIILDVILAKLDSHGMTPKEKERVMSAVKKILHHELLTVILHHLPRDHHERFLKVFHKSPADKNHMEYLKAHAHPHIEQLLSGKVTEVLEAVLADLMGDDQ